MREVLFILIVFAVIAVLTAIRYRRQLMAMLQIYRGLKSMRTQMRDKQVKPEPEIPAGPLVNCSKCGTWIPEQRAIKLRGGTFYCSSSCLESAVPAR